MYPLLAVYLCTITCTYAGPSYKIHKCIPTKAKTKSMHFFHLFTHMTLAEPAMLRVLSETVSQGLMYYEWYFLIALSPAISAAIPKQISLMKFLLANPFHPHGQWLQQVNVLYFLANLASSYLSCLAQRWGPWAGRSRSCPWPGLTAVGRSPCWGGPKGRLVPLQTPRSSTNTHNSNSHDMC